MQVSLNWLNEFVDLSDIDEKQIAHELTMSGLEVEDVEHFKPQFKNIITAKILKIDTHPNADKLHLVTVDIGKEQRTVVCGAQNIEEGQIIPYASVGSEVFSRKTGEMFTLTPAEIRGVKSEGMLCSSDELGLSDRNYQSEDGILILNRFLKNVELGKPLEEILGLEEDIILHCAPTANRGDEMSVIGIARELCAIFDKELKFSPLESTVDLNTNKFKVEIIDQDVCKYYSIGVLENITIKPSPAWMQKRLIASGIRAISNVVDITNYVLLEYGIPLHAFDLKKLKGYLCVRRAKQGEKITTLDGVERELTTDSVLIATREKGVCLAGVFGGQNSEVDSNTNSIALEAAYFTPASNRKSSHSVGYRSDACARFERGVDIEAVKPALMRAMQLLAEHAGAKVVGMVDDGQNKIEKPEITLRFAQIKRILGCEIPAQRCISILEKLGFKTLGKNEVAAKFEVPSFRVNDVTREIDLIEEIARINGYDKIAPTLPGKNESPIISIEEKTIKQIHSILLSSGLNEIITSSLIGKPFLTQFSIDYDKEKSVEVENAQSEEFTMLRQTLSANILNCLKYNYDNGQKNFWAYEIGKIYFKNAPADEKNSGVDEIKMLAGCITGEIENSKWHKTQETNFFTLKGIFEKLFNELGISNRIQFRPCENVDILHPHRSASLVLLGKNLLEIGYMGQIHPILRDRLKLNQEAFLFEVNLEEIIKAINPSITKYKKLPQFPEVQRDLAFIVPKIISCEELQKAIKKSVQQNIFKNCEIFDVYQGEHIEKGFKSVAFRIKMQDEQATLTDEIIDAQMNSIKNNLEKTFEKLTFRV
ncbi:MAG TPA: phenylalanine--tRNA ligase subunit beta [Candidatus Gastranaerophilaceae bacterium]|nr:phenylalanine--tRNA ligase subunit beta [Candidatus Gastranaerophilaceae bacterium]